MFIDGQPACVKCLKRPRRKSKGRYQSYCRVCHQEYCAVRRAGMVERLLTQEEWAIVQRARLVGWLSR